MTRGTVQASLTLRRTQTWDSRCLWVYCSSPLAVVDDDVPRYNRRAVNFYRHRNSQVICRNKGWWTERYTCWAQEHLEMIPLSWDKLDSSAALLLLSMLRYETQQRTLHVLLKNTKAQVERYVHVMDGCSSHLGLEEWVGSFLDVVRDTFESERDHNPGVTWQQ